MHNSNNKLRVILCVPFVLVVFVLVMSRYTNRQKQEAKETLGELGVESKEDSYIENKTKELKNKEDEELKNHLIEYGYSEETVDALLEQGAKRAIPLKNIAAVREEYGVHWNLPLYIGDYELVSLYLVGNTDIDRFVLGQYEDRTGEHVVFVHMGQKEQLDELKAGLIYTTEVVEDLCTMYMDEANAVVGYKFNVKSIGDLTGAITYVVTGSDVFTQDDVVSFLSAIVDGTLVN